MVIYDYETKANREFKRRMEYLTDAERDILFSLSETEQDALLILKDNGQAYEVRLAWGRKLSTEVLRVVADGYQDGFKSLADVILAERGINS